MVSMRDLPPKLVEKIFNRIPITSLRAVRSTCKSWSSLSKECIVGEAAAARQHQFLGFMTMNYNLCSVRFDLRGIRSSKVEPSVKQVALFDRVRISQVFHVDGLLLLVTLDRSSLVVWNPYLEQQRCIGPRRSFQKSDKYAIGYDNNHNHKILRVFNGYKRKFNGNVNIPYVEHELYDFRSNTWKVLDATPSWIIDHHNQGVTLKGNTYFLATDQKGFEEDFLLCFDFTRERFGPRLNLPYEKDHTVSLSCMSEEKFTVLRQKSGNSFCFLDIWVTDKIEPNAVSWNKFLSVDIGRQIDFPFDQEAASFFIDKEKKVVVVFDTTKTIFDDEPPETCCYIIGEDGYFKDVTLGDINMHEFSPTSLVSSFYRPSLWQIKQKSKCKRKR